MGGADYTSRHLRRDLLIALGSMLLLEVVGQLVPAPDPLSLDGRDGEAEGVFLKGNPYLLWELTPGVQPFDGGEIRVNSLGLRDRQRGPKTRPRVAVVGDSSIYGLGVRDQQLFTAILEERMQADFINAGVPGYSTVQIHNQLDLKVLPLEPDVLIAATVWSDNNFDFFHDADMVVDLGNDRAAAGVWLRTALEHSGLFRWADWAVSELGRRRKATEIHTVLQAEAVATGSRRVPIGTYAANLERFCERMHAREGAVVFLVLPNKEDVRPTFDDPPWVPYREVLRTVAARWNALVIDLPSVFASMPERTLFWDPVHPNVPGHQVMAQAVEDTLRRAGWPERPLRLTPPSSPLPEFEDPFEGRGIELGLTDPEGWPDL